MYKIVFISLLLFAYQAAHSEDSFFNEEAFFNNAPNVGGFSGRDDRQLVSMSDQARELMRKDMLSYLSALDEIIGYLASDNLNAAADVAENRMGRSSMERHRGTGMEPDRNLPFEMLNQGMRMNDAATAFSKIAKRGNLNSAYSALQKVTSSCVACHSRYRIR